MAVHRDLDTLVTLQFVDFVTDIRADFSAQLYAEQTPKVRSELLKSIVRDYLEYMSNPRLAVDESSTGSRLLLNGKLVLADSLIRTEYATKYNFSKPE